MPASVALEDQKKKNPIGGKTVSDFQFPAKRKKRQPKQRSNLTPAGEQNTFSKESKRRCSIEGTFLILPV